MSTYKLSPAEARAKWIEALRSGEYAQTFETLRRETPIYKRDSDGYETDEIGIPAGYCCLGVACDLYMKLEGLGRWDGSVFETNTRDDAYLPYDVRKWLDLPQCEGFMTEHYGAFKDLSERNDLGEKFDQIADVIEQWLGK